MCANPLHVIRTINSFLIKLLLFSLPVAVGNYCWNRFMPGQYLIPHGWFIFTFFVGTTALFHFITMNAAKGNPKNFIRYYMGAAGLRMLLFVIAILTYRFINKPCVIPFAIAFLVHYVLFTIFEVTTLLRYLRK